MDTEPAPVLPPEDIAPEDSTSDDAASRSAASLDPLSTDNWLRHARAGIKASYLAAGWGAIAGDLTGILVQKHVAIQIPAAKPDTLHHMLENVSKIAGGMPDAVVHSITSASIGAGLFGAAAMGYQILQRRHMADEAIYDIESQYEKDARFLERYIALNPGNDRALEKIAGIRTQIRVGYANLAKLARNGFVVPVPPAVAAPASPARAQTRPAPSRPANTWYDSLSNWSGETFRIAATTAVASAAVGVLRTNILDTAITPNGSFGLEPVITSAIHGGIAGLAIGVVTAPYVTEMRRATGYGVRLGAAGVLLATGAGAALGYAKDGFVDASASPVQSATSEASEAPAIPATEYWKNGFESGLAQSAYALELVPAFVAAAFLKYARVSRKTFAPKPLLSTPAVR